MRLSPLLFSLASLLLPVPALAGPATQPAAAWTTTVLTRALDSVQEERIRADLHFLASDELRGRDTPSPEQRIAARFLAARLERLGWQPGAQDGWFWEYELPTVAIDPARTSLVGSCNGVSVGLQLGEDYAFYPRSIADLETEGHGIVFIGTGSEEELEQLEKRRVELEDRWLLCTSSDISYMKLSSIARKNEAAGVLVAPGGELDSASMAERVRGWANEASEGRLSRGRRNKRARSYVYLSSDGLAKLEAAASSRGLELGDVLPIELVEKRTVLEEATAGLENVVGIWPGSDPALAKELIILSAHYDHVGTSDEGEVYNGADDNGSGTVGLLAVAEALTVHGPLRRSVMIIWVSGEEKGLLGSKAWTEDPYLPGGLKPVANINIDMIGRNDPRSLLVTPTADHDEYNGLTKLAQGMCRLEGFDPLGSADAYWTRSDHANFADNLEIPVAFLFADVHEDYHKVTDTPDKVDYDKVRRVARLVVRIVAGLQTDRLDL